MIKEGTMLIPLALLPALMQADLANPTVVEGYCRQYLCPPICRGQYTFCGRKRRATAEDENIRLTDLYNLQGKGARGQGYRGPGYYQQGATGKEDYSMNSAEITALEERLSDLYNLQGKGARGQGWRPHWFYDGKEELSTKSAAAERIESGKISIMYRGPGFGLPDAQ